MKPQHRLNLASERLGATVLAANDDFFAVKDDGIGTVDQVFFLAQPGGEVTIFSFPGEAKVFDFL